METQWNEKAKMLVGKKIVSAYYMSKTEAEEMGWYSRPLILELEGGTFLIPSSDDEGNNGGALLTNAAPHCWPVIR